MKKSERLKACAYGSSVAASTGLAKTYVLYKTKNVSHLNQQLTFTVSECDITFFTMGNFAAAQHASILRCENVLSDRETRRMRAARRPTATASSRADLSSATARAAPSQPMP
jgi:hypothetical protein